MTINQKLATIQTKFKSKKSRFNSFGKYYFRSAEDILESIKPFLLELGVAVTINEELIETNPMPIKKAALKALRQSKKRYLHNKKIKDNLKFLIKKSRKLIEAKNKEEAKKFVKKTIVALDKAAKSKIIKKNTTARKKSRLMRSYNKM